MTEGCKGIISLTNNNWSLKLSITFGDVWLAAVPRCMPQHSVAPLWPTTAAANNVLYDLQGRRVQTPAKGLYIRNGRKVMVK